MIFETEHLILKFLVISYHGFSELKLTKNSSGTMWKTRLP